MKRIYITMISALLVTAAPSLFGAAAAASDESFYNPAEFHAITAQCPALTSASPGAFATQMTDLFISFVENGTLPLYVHTFFELMPPDWERSDFAPPADAPEAVRLLFKIALFIDFNIAYMAARLIPFGIVLTPLQGKTYHAIILAINLHHVYSSRTHDKESFYTIGSDQKTRHTIIHEQLLSITKKLVESL